MKIIYYSPHPDLALNAKSGYGTHMREMIKAFEQMNHKVTPLIMGGIDDPSTLNGTSSVSNRSFKEKIKGVIPKFFWESLKDYNLLQRDQQYIAKLEEYINRIKPDLIYERAAYLQLSGVETAGKYGIPHVLEMNSPYIVERKIRHGTGSLLTRKARRVERKQLKRTLVPTVVSPALKEYFLQEHNLGNQEIVCLPNAIDPETVRTDPKQIEDIKKKYALQDRFVVGFVGSITKYQRVDLLIRAGANLCKTNPNIRLLIVGDSPSRRGLEQLCKTLGIETNVIFTGKVEHAEVFNFVKAMHIAVLPDNLWYGSPTKIFEYGALGVAVIAPDNVTLRGLLRHNEEGILVKPEVKSLTSAIELLMKDKILRNRMAKAFQARVFNEFTWDKNAEHVFSSLSKQLKNSSSLQKIVS